MLDVGQRGRHKQEEPGIVGIMADGKPFSAAIFVRLPKGTRTGARYVFYINHWSGGRLVGGSEYELRVGERVTKQR